MFSLLQVHQLKLFQTITHGPICSNNNCDIYCLLSVALSHHLILLTFSTSASKYTPPPPPGNSQSPITVLCMTWPGLLPVIVIIRIYITLNLNLVHIS